MVDVVAAKPSKAAIKRLWEGWKTIWNHKFGAKINGISLIHSFSEILHKNT